ncbi:hypothetical protein ACED16_19190 [Enterobacter hormaechei]
MSQKEFLDVIQPYGFIECGEMQIFLQTLCEKYLCRADLFWLMHKLKQCLKNNSDGSDYFCELEKLKFDIERKYPTYF